MKEKRTIKKSIKKSVKNTDHNRDISSKKVFQNPVLCAQFLRDNFDIPELKHVNPGDISDISERFLPYLGSEFDADSVNQIRILDIGRRGKRTGKEDIGDPDADESNPPFYVSLIDHKSFVDYDVSMQLLRYMMCIWTEYRREMEEKKEGCTQRKSFRYPVIIPIVYFEGRSGWTADRHLGGRIGNGTAGREWIPDFKYEVVRIHDYSNEELLERGNEMALVMLINKVQKEADLEEFIRIPKEELNRIIKESPKHVVDVLASVMESLCFKIDTSEETRTECVRKVRKREMGYLFESMEHISIQEMQRKTEEEKQKAWKEVEEEKQKAWKEVEEEKQKAWQEVEEEKRRARCEVEEEKRKAKELEEKLQEAEDLLKQFTLQNKGN